MRARWGPKTTSSLRRALVWLSREIIAWLCIIISRTVTWLAHVKPRAGDTLEDRGLRRTERETPRLMKNPNFRFLFLEKCCWRNMKCISSRHLDFSSFRRLLQSPASKTKERSGWVWSPEPKLKMVLGTKTLHLFYVSKSPVAFRRNIFNIRLLLPQSVVQVTEHICHLKHRNTKACNCDNSNLGNWWITIKTEQ